MGAPPHTGLEQRLRRKRPQEPGGCMRARLRFMLRSWPLYRPAEACLQRIVSQPCMRYSNDLGPAQFAFARQIMRARQREAAGPAPDRRNRRAFALPALPVCSILPQFFS
jgi:hypothetical protein